MQQKELMVLDNKSLQKICDNSIELVKYARNSAVRQINIFQIMTYYCIGKWIVEEQQKGERRAKYGKRILKFLSDRLNEEFGKESNFFLIIDNINSKEIEISENAKIVEMSRKNIFRVFKMLLGYDKIFLHNICM